MPPAVAAINSTWDMSTQVATQYWESFVESLLVQNGFTVNELQGADANQASAAAAASDPSVSYIYGISHGSGDTFTGDQDATVFTTGALDPAVFKGKVVHFLACDCASFLGRAIVDPASGGAKAFLGYNGPFTWPDDGDTQYSGTFFDCDAEIDRQLAAGQSAGVAMQQALALYSAKIAFLKSQGDDTSLNLAAILETNRDLLRGPLVDNEYGSATATIR